MSDRFRFLLPFVCFRVHDLICWSLPLSSKCNNKLIRVTSVRVYVRSSIDSHKKMIKSPLLFSLWFFLLQWYWFRTDPTILIGKYQKSYFSNCWLTGQPFLTYRCVDVFHWYLAHEIIFIANLALLLMRFSEIPVEFLLGYFEFDFSNNLFGSWKRKSSGNYGS